MLVLPTDWSPKNTSLYFAKADTGAIFLISKREERLSKVLERIWLGFGFGFDSIWEMKWERESYGFGQCIELNFVRVVIESPLRV